MPELPDIVVYVERLEPRIVGQPLEAIRLGNPFVLRSVSPAVDEACGQTVAHVRRLGKRIVYAENEANYCPRCQTGGRLLADRALSRLLRDDWPRTLDQLERPA
jgi:formamidopyrimidine-DNA glycosylase